MRGISAIRNELTCNAIVLILFVGGSFLPAQGQVELIKNTRLVSGTVTRPDSESYPVRLYEVAGNMHLHLLSELKADHGTYRPKDLEDSGGVRSIAVIGSHIFVDYPYDITSATLVVSTVSAKIEGRVEFDPLHLGSHENEPIFFVSKDDNACDVWSVPTAPAKIDSNGLPEYPSYAVRSVCAVTGQYPTVQNNTPRQYTNPLYPGEPGGPEGTAYTFVKLVAGNLVIPREGGVPSTVLLQQVPPELRDAVEPAENLSARAKPMILRAANENYVVVRTVENNGDNNQQSSQIAYVIDLHKHSLAKLNIEGNDSLVRIFHNWLSVIVQSAKSAGADHCGVEDANDWRIPPGELDRAVKEGRLSAPASPKDNPPPPPRTQSTMGTTPAQTGVPDASQEFASNRGCTDDITGRLVLYNLADHRKIVIEGLDKDIEAVDFLKPDLVLLRSGDKLYLQTIHGSSLGARQLIAQDSDVPQIHWAFQMH